MMTATNTAAAPVATTAYQLSGEPMPLLADIATGNTELADVAFLVAVILAVLSALAAWAPAATTDPARPWVFGRFAGPLLSAALAAAALGLLVL